MDAERQVIVKFTRGGKGRARALARYLLRERDHKKKKRAAVRVLRGDPLDVGSLADRHLAKRVRKYSHAILAWAPEDQPTPEQIDAVLDDFEKWVYAGLDPARSGCWAAVRHDDEDGGVHVHCLVARIDLQSGKTFNPAPPGWERGARALQDLHDLKNGWASPQEAKRQRVPTRHRDLADKPVNEVREILGAAVAEDVKAGRVQSRDDIEAALLKRGKKDGFEITRQGFDYISIRHVGRRAVRLKGSHFDKRWWAARANGAPAAGTEPAPIERQVLIDRAEKRFEHFVERREAFNPPKIWPAARSGGAGVPGRTGQNSTRRQ